MVTFAATTVTTLIIPTREPAQSPASHFVAISFSGASIGKVTYGWDMNPKLPLPSLRNRGEGSGVRGGYDSEDRLIGFTRSSGLTQSWSLSEVGDWDSVTTNSTTETRTHGPTHELLTAGGNSVSTDTKGNITLIPAAVRPNASSLLMNWDFDNRLNTADVGNNSSIDVTYKFDAMGRRVFRDDGTTAMVYVQSGQQTIADYTASSAPSSPIYRYVYASYIDEPVLRFKLSGSESLYYHRNQQYSVVALTDGSAAIVERYAYSAYGVPTITNASGTVLTLGSVDNRYMYTGREWDQALSLYHYRARMYDANLGRFASRDPIGWIDHLGYYCAFHGNPILKRDPSGLASCTPNWTGPCNVENYLSWVAKEKAELNTWINDVPACPCTLTCTVVLCTTEVINHLICPSPPPGFIDVLPNPTGEHPGTVAEVRSACVNACKPGAQCNYDASGQLITKAPGAGTTDRYSGACWSFGVFPINTEHFKGDVSPFKCAKDLAFAELDPSYIRFYNDVRPSNSGKPCDSKPRIVDHYKKPFSVIPNPKSPQFPRIKF